MKTLLLITIFVGSLSCGFSQSISILNQNNVSAYVSDQGTFFSHWSTATSGYEVPAGSGTNAIFSAGLWFGGTDVNGQLKLAAETYFDGQNIDFAPGTVTRYDPWEWMNIPGIIDYFGQTMWTVTRAQIDDHIANYQSGTYTMPADIANWPAQGDTSLGTFGMLPYIAPFVDVNNDGQYDPLLGDYPCIKGDRATYVILNDVRLHTSSNGDPIGMQLHYMFYQYSTVPGLENTTFVDAELVNMGTQTLNDFVASFYLDSDLGNYADDFVGTDTLRNMIFTYNGDNMDETNSGITGYGVAPPALGLKILSHSLDYSISYTNSSIFPYTDPQNSAQYYNAMMGNWADGSDQLDINSNPTNHFYTGDPNTPGSWSENNGGNPPGDRRMVASTNLGVLTPDMSYGAVNRTKITYAVVFGQGTDNLNSVVELQNSADFVQTFYDNQTDNCFDLSLAGLLESESLNFDLYPNPNNGSFQIVLPEDVQDGQVQLLDVTGRLILQLEFSQTTPIEVATTGLSGMYFVVVSSGSSKAIERVIIE